MSQPFMNSMDDLASLEETLEVVSRPKLVAPLRESLDDMAAGWAEVLSRDAVLAGQRD